MPSEREYQIIRHMNRENQKRFAARSPYRFDWRGVRLGLYAALVLTAAVWMVIRWTH